MDIIRELPHNEEAEKNIIGILMQTDQIGDVIAEEQLKSEDFYSQKLKVIYETMLQMYDNNMPIDLITLSEQLKGNPVFDGKEVLYLKASCGSVVTTHNLKYYCGIVKQCSLRRRYIAQTEKIQNLAYSPDSTVTEIENNIDALLNDDTSTSEMHSIQELMMPIFQKLVSDGKGKGQIPGHKTGFPSIDAFTGGLIDGNMVVIAARPGMGKSIMGNNIAEFTAFHEDKPAIIFNLEMTSEEVLYRIISSQTNIDYSHIQFCNVSGDDFGRIGTFGNSLKNKKLYIHDESYMSIAKIRSYARKIKRIYGEIGVIVIDYLQLIDSENSDKRNFNRNNEISENSRKLKLLAKELNCPVVVLSQLSRENERRNEKRPLLSDLRDSGAIEQDADMVMFIHREDYYDRDKQTGNAEIIVAKNRHGKTGTVKLSWQPQIMKFMEWSEVNKYRKQKESKKNEEK